MLDPDAELMVAVKGGDRRAFATLFDKHVRSLVNFTYRFVGDRARAEELAQDVFMKIYRSAASYQPTAKFKTYLFRVATNHCMNERRRGVYRAPHDSADATEFAQIDSTTPEHTVHGKELEQALGAALDDLSPRERAAFTLCRFEGMAYRDIAEALETTEAAVKSLIHRASLTVTRHLEPLCGLQKAHG